MDGREVERANVDGHGGVAAAPPMSIRSHAVRIMTRLIPNIDDLGYAMAARLATSRTGPLDLVIRRELENRLGADYSSNLIVQIKLEIIQMMQSRLARSCLEETIHNFLKTRRCLAEVGGGRKEEEICSVCLYRLHEEDGAIATLDCQHGFHEDCIKQWLMKGKNSCPLCREKALHGDKVC